jgi:hypothetical protein
MIKSFNGFITEEINKKSSFIKSLASSLIKKIESVNLTQEYSSFNKMEFKNPFMFDLIFNIRKDNFLNSKSDQHFKSLPWEELNFKQLGYAIDANAKISKSKSSIPIIVIHLVISNAYKKDALYYRLIDILYHETNHLSQVGLNSEPFNVEVSSKETREKAKGGYEYFLLNDEIESMIEGMYERSKTENSELDKIFINYLNPFLQTNYITKSQYIKILSTWIKRSLELYPDAKFSNQSNSIINTI